MYEIKPRRLSSQMLTCFIFLVLFSKKKITLSFKKTTYQKNSLELRKNQELDGINIDDIGNLQDLPRLEFIDEEYENLTVVNDGGEVTRNMEQWPNG